MGEKYACQNWFKYFPSCFLCCARMAVYPFFILQISILQSWGGWRDPTAQLKTRSSHQVHIQKIPDLTFILRNTAHHELLFINVLI